MATPTLETDAVLDALIAFARIRQQQLDFDLGDVIHEIHDPNMTAVVARFLLYRLDGHRHSKEQVRELLTLWPECLLCKDRWDNFPIQTLADYHHPRWTSTFIPMMAEIGMTQNVGGEGKRGGLLIPDVCGKTTLESVIGNVTTTDPEVVVQLKKMNLLVASDVQNFDLLSEAYWIPDLTHDATFNLLVDLDPDGLGPKKGYCEGDDTRIAFWRQVWSGQMRWFPEPTIFSPLNSRNNLAICRRQFELALKAGVRSFPEHFGFLFHEGDKKKWGDESTPFQLAIKIFGADVAMKIIKRCIPPSADCSRLLLNYAIKKAPSLIDIISQHYLDQVSSKDPATGLYPFMMAAQTKYEGDLSGTYSLMRSNPGLVQVYQSALPEANRFSRSNPRQSICEFEGSSKKQKIAHP